MRKIRDVLRLTSSGLTIRETGLSLRLGRTTVKDHLRRAVRAGLSWPLDDGLTDRALEALMLLWEEYRAVHAQGYG
jgi:Arc/MetJ family transcription regulator